MIPTDSKLPPIGVGVISGELTRYADFMQSLVQIMVPPNSTILWHCGALIREVMNMTFQTFVKLKHLEYIWVIGDDHTFPPNIVLDLATLDKDAVIPLVLNRQPPCHPCIVNENDKTMRRLSDIPFEPFKLEDYETCGDAGMLLSRRVVEAIGYPWYENLISGTWMSEDRYFANKIRKAGFEIWCHPNVSMGHITPVNVLPEVRKQADGTLIRCLRLMANTHHLASFMPEEVKHD